MLSTVASQQVLGLNPCCCRSALQVQHGFHLLSSTAKHMHGVSLIGNSKLAIGVNLSVNGSLSLHVSPVIRWQPVQACTLPSRPITAGIGFGAPLPHAHHNHELNKQKKMEGWMVRFYEENVGFKKKKWLRVSYWYLCFYSIIYLKLFIWIIEASHMPPLINMHIFCKDIFECEEKLSFEFYSALSSGWL